MIALPCVRARFTQSLLSRFFSALYLVLDIYSDTPKKAPHFKRFCLMIICLMPVDLVLLSYALIYLNLVLFHTCLFNGN